MITNEQINTKIKEISKYGCKYKVYSYILGGNETLEKKDIKLHGIDGLSLRGKGKLLDIDVIKEFSEIKFLTLSEHQYTSINTLNAFCEIEHFRGPNLADSTIPFNTFLQLRSADVIYDHKTCYLLFENKGLRFLELYHYKQKSWDNLIKINGLKHLALQQCTLESLSFLEYFQQLNYFATRFNNKLRSIHGITQAKCLKGIEIKNGKNISDWHTLSEAQQLKGIILEDCGVIDSLAFLESFPDLKILWIKGNTIIKDGSFKSIVEKESLEWVAIAVHKHYDITIEDLRRFNFSDPLSAVWAKCNLYEAQAVEGDIVGQPYKEIKPRMSIEDKEPTFCAEDFQADLGAIIESMRNYLVDEDDEIDILPAGYSEEAILAFQNIMQEFLKGIAKLQSIDEIISITKETVLKLNHLNATVGGELIETEQRENIVTLILDVIESVGVEIQDDITLKWREW